jgi:hypothetical protein
MTLYKQNEMSLQAIEMVRYERVQSMSAIDAVEKFHKAQHGKKIPISIEPNCWNGFFRNKDVMAEVYPNAARSHRPQFVNAAGQYMGYYAKSLLVQYAAKFENTRNSSREI